VDPDQAKALRAPFPEGAVGKLPKPYRADSPRGECRVCGGYHGLPAAHLDYVGHAATTDRLLAVDPSWTWEPLALDPNGLPALDGRGNLWIRLTVAGVTRIGVGDGKSAKEVIGDAIRNAAMRFGVALDLWAKEDLSAMAAERGDPPATPASAAVVAPAAPPGAPTPGTPDEAAGAADKTTGPTTAQSARIHALYRARGMGREDYLEDAAEFVGRRLQTTNDLSKAEASRLIDYLLAHPVQTNP
jgi:hypothetical protein